MRLRRRRDQRTALLVPIPEAEPAFAQLGLPPGGLGAAPGLPAHVTVLYPFVPHPAAAAAEVGHALAAVARDAAPFAVRFASVARFPGVLYLAPDPPHPFSALTEAVQARWPEHPPYEGAYEENVPHLTVAAGGEPDGLADALTRHLPLQARATRLLLMVEERGAWRTQAEFPLGGHGP